MHVHTHASMHTHTHIHTHTYIHTHIHTHKHTHNYMHAHMGSMLLLFLNFWQSCFCQHSHPDEPFIQTARTRSSCCREISIFRLWSCEMLNPVCKSHFPCVQDSGFPEINHTAQFSWSSPPCTLILGERELPWPAWPWTDGHGDCGQQVSFCPKQYDLEQRVMETIASRWAFCPEQCDLEQKVMETIASRWVFLPEQHSLKQMAMKTVSSKSVLFWAVRTGTDDQGK